MTFKDLKSEYEMGYVTVNTLKKWVQVEREKPGKGITAEEYAEITGAEYSED